MFLPVVYQNKFDTGIFPLTYPPKPYLQPCTPVAGRADRAPAITLGPRTLAATNVTSSTFIPQHLIQPPIKQPTPWQIALHDAGVGLHATEDPTVEEAEAEATGTIATADAMTTTTTTTTAMIATTGDGTDLGRETETETLGDREGIETAGAIAPGPATGQRAALEGLVTEATATATTTIRGARGTMVAVAAIGAQGATALRSIGMVRFLFQTWDDYCPLPLPLPLPLSRNGSR